MAVNIFEKNRTVRPSGPSLQEKYDAGKKAYAASLRKNRGQAGGINSISPQAKKATMDNLNRQKFFKGRDVPEERLRRRIKQDSLERQFKDKFTKPVNIVDSEGNVTGVVSGLTQATDDAPRSLTAERERLANIFGPTPSEIFGDIGFGLGNIFQGFAEKGTPMVQLFKGLSDKFKGGVERAWDAVRGETTTAQGTAFPQPDPDTKDLFSSINTGIAADPNSTIREGEFFIDPNSTIREGEEPLLVRIAKENANRFANNQTFEEQLANATAQNFNVPSITDIVETTNDYLNAAKAGVDVNTPIGNVNLNALNETLSLGNALGDNINYGGMINREGDYNVGISTALPGDFRLSAGASSNDLPGMRLSNTYLPKIFGTDIRGMGNVVPSVNMSGQGDLSLGLNTTVDPLRMMGINSAIPFDIGVGANINDQGQFIPNLNFNLPFNSNSGLGFMLK